MPKNQEEEFEPHVTAQVIGQMLHVHPKTVRRMAQTGEIPAVRIASPVGRVFYRFQKKAVLLALRKPTRLPEGGDK